jgi:hypothetical protein
VDGWSNHDLRIILKAKATQQPPLTTSDRVSLANADEKQKPAKKLSASACVSKLPAANGQLIRSIGH